MLFRWGGKRKHGNTFNIFKGMKIIELVGIKKDLKSISDFNKISQKAGLWAIKVALLSFSLFDVRGLLFAVGNLLIS